MGTGRFPRPADQAPGHALYHTRAANWSIDVTVFFPNWIIVMGSGMYFTHQMWPLAADRVIWQMRGYVRPASNAAQRFG